MRPSTKIGSQQTDVTAPDIHELKWNDDSRAVRIPLCPNANPETPTALSRPATQQIIRRDDKITQTLVSSRSSRPSSTTSPYCVPSLRWVVKFRARFAGGIVIAGLVLIMFLLRRLSFSIKCTQADVLANHSGLGITARMLSV